MAKTYPALALDRLRFGYAKDKLMQMAAKVIIITQLNMSMVLSNLKCVFCCEEIWRNLLKNKRSYEIFHTFSGKKF